MLKTEEEAAEIWCPESRVTNVRLGVNGSNRGTTDVRCYASNCMAWRWAEKPPQTKTSERPIDGWIHTPAHISEDGKEYWQEPYPLALKRRRGFCGNFGKVEIP